MDASELAVARDFMFVSNAVDSSSPHSYDQLNGTNQDSMSDTSIDQFGASNMMTDRSTLERDRDTDVDEEEGDEDDDSKSAEHYISNNSDGTNNATTNDATSQRQQQHHQPQSGSKKLFPQKLWDLINDSKYSFCLRWSEDGQLVYLNRDEFEESYLKTGENQFHTQKAISFVRQMNMYGFRKVDDCYYENDNFKRGCEHLLRNMNRKHSNKHLITNNEHHHRQNNSMLVNNTLDLNNSDNEQFLPTQLQQHSFAQHRRSAAMMQNLERVYEHKEQPLAKSAQHVAHNGYGSIDNESNPSANNALATDMGSLGALYALLSGLSNLYQPQAAQLTQPASQPQQATAAAVAAAAQLQVLQNLMSHSNRLNLDRSSSLQRQLIDMQQQQQQQQQMPLRQQQLDQLLPMSLRSHNATTQQHQSAGVSPRCSPEVARQQPKISTSLTPLGIKKEYIHNEDSLLARHQTPTTNSYARGSPQISKSARHFKRSVDSILESSGCVNTNKFNTDAKRIKKEDHTSTELCERLTKNKGVSAMCAYPTEHSINDNQKLVLELAKALVDQVASSRGARIDGAVLEEASRYTTKVVETLFETAQVIARHSNNNNCGNSSNNNMNHSLGSSNGNNHHTQLDSSPSPSPLSPSSSSSSSAHTFSPNNATATLNSKQHAAQEHNHAIQSISDGINLTNMTNQVLQSATKSSTEKEIERSYIHIGDLTSALKLLPSKLLKLLK